MRQAPIINPWFHMVPGAVRASGTCTPIRAKVSKRRSNAFGAKDAGLGFQKTPMVDTLQPFQGYKLQSVVKSTSCIINVDLCHLTKYEYILQFDPLQQRGNKQLAKCNFRMGRVQNQTHSPLSDIKHIKQTIPSAFRNNSHHSGIC
jgi:hypothetical protein